MEISPYMAKIKLMESKKKKYKGFTIKDLNSLSEKEASEYDDRGFVEYFKDKICDEHPLISLAMKKSLMEPLNLRLSKFFIRISLMFALNAMFFSDYYMEIYALKYIKYTTPLVSFY